MYGNNLFNSNGAFPVFLSSGEFDDNNPKLAHDCYDIYVNRDYVGTKTLIAQNETPKDVESYLKKQGFHNFDASIDAGNILINSSEQEADNIKRNLNVYLNIR